MCNRLLMSVCLAFVLTSLALSQEPQDFAKWEKAIAAFEQQDREQAPPKDGIVFVGSSSIRMWDVKKAFPELPVINRGFGGSQLADSVHFAPRIVLPYKPRTIVVYAGDNDLKGGKTPETVFRDFQDFVKVVRKELPKTRIIYLSIKPSPSRWNIYDKASQVNGLIGAFCKEQQGVQIVDVGTVLLGDDGKPKPELFIKDQLHLNPQGYALWNKVLQPYLAEGK